MSGGLLDLPCPGILTGCCFRRGVSKAGVNEGLGVGTIEAPREVGKSQIAPLDSLSKSIKYALIWTWNKIPFIYFLCWYKSKWQKPKCLMQQRRSGEVGIWRIVDILSGEICLLYFTNGYCFQCWCFRAEMSSNGFCTEYQCKAAHNSEQRSSHWNFCFNNVSWHSCNRFRSYWNKKLHIFQEYPNSPGDWPPDLHFQSIGGEIAGSDTSARFHRNVEMPHHVDHRLVLWLSCNNRRRTFSRKCLRSSD